MASNAPILLLDQHHGIPGGMNLASAPHEIPVNEARYLQDILLDRPGMIRQRGPITKASTQVVHTSANLAYATLTRVDGTLVHYAQNVSGTEFIAAGVSNPVWSSVGGSGGAATDVVQYRPTIDGTLAYSYMASYTQASAGTKTVGFRAGGIGTSLFYTTGTATVTRGSTAVTGSGTSWSSNVSPGYYLRTGAGVVIGIVKSVNSNTSITLAQGALFPLSAASYQLASTQAGLYPKVTKGRITTSTGSTAVNGAGTNFTMMSNLSWDSYGGGTPSFDLFRLSDLTYIGTISSVTTDTALTLSSNAALALNNERYVAIANNVTPNDASVGGKGPGILTTVYQGRQFYANNPGTAQTTSRIWFSDPSDPQAIDMRQADGDWFDVQTQNAVPTPITGVVGLQNAMAIFKPNELWALLGSDPTNFQVRKIADVGAWDVGSIQVWNNMVIFASKQGIMGFDGVKVFPLSLNLGDFYKDATKVSKGRVFSMIHRDHYFVSFADFNNTFERYKGPVSGPPVTTTISLNLNSGAITFHSNLQIRGAVAFAPSTGLGTWFVAHDAGGNSSYLCDADALFNSTGRDAFASTGETLGPAFYLESRKYDMNNPELKKLFTQLQMHYKAVGDTITMDNVTGINTGAGTTSIATWPLQPTFKLRRIKFMKRDTHVSFRLYPTSNTLSDFQIGPWALLYRVLRPGLV